jgi:putative transcriptional regulator
MRLLVAALLVVLATNASAQERVEPARGVFLVAKPEIDSGSFYRSVVLLLVHGEEGTVGVIVNRPTGVLLSEAIPDLVEDDTSHPLYFGGPVGLEGLLVLFRSDAPSDGSEAVMEDLYFSGDREVLEELLKQGKPDDELRLFIGHSGWARGQLDAEISRGAWEVQRADAFTVFRTEPEWMWELLSGSGRMIARSPRASRLH